MSLKEYKSQGKAVEVTVNSKEENSFDKKSQGKAVVHSDCE